MKKAFSFFFLLSLAARQYAQTDFQSALQLLTQDSTMRHASWGFYAVDVNTGQTVAEYNPQAFLLPASSLKVVTTASALAILGGNFCYKTGLYYTGAIKDSLLNGNLILRTSGDPSLGSLLQENVILADSLQSLYAYSLKKNGIKSDEKLSKYGFILDNSIFKTSTPETWEIGDLAESYGAVASSFVVNENVLELKIRRTMARERRPFISNSYPKLAPSDYANFKFTTIATESNSLDLENYLAKKVLKGEIAAGLDSFNLRIANTNATENFTTTLLNKIAPSSTITPRIINYDDKYTAANKLNYDSTRLLYNYSSPTLAALVKRCNERSVNIYAETFLKTIGSKSSLDGTTEAGIATLTGYWKKRKIDMDGLKMVDGSGLSRHNAVTPFFMANFMRAIWLDKKIAEPFYLSLPIAGETGTLEKWFKDSPAKGKIRAKTGSMSGVLSYTGYALRTNGSTIAFCLIVNQYSGKANDMRKKLTWILGKLVEI